MKRIHKISIIVILLTVFFLFGCNETTTKSKYLVSYYVDNALYDSKQYVEGSEIVLQPLTKEGYDFDGWYLDIDLTSGPYSTYTIDKAYSFYGKFAVIDNDVYQTIRLIDEIDLNDIKASSITIQNAKNKYDALSEEDKANITNYDALDEAYQALEAILKAETKIVSEINQQINALPYTVNYFDNELFTEIIAKVNNLTIQSQDSISGLEYLEYIKSVYQNITSSNDYIVYPYYIYNNLQELKNDLAYAIYRFVVEKYGMDMLNQIGAYELEDFQLNFINLLTDNEILASLYYPNNIENSIDSINEDYIFGYFYKNDMFKETLLSLLALESELNATKGIFIDNVASLNLLASVLSGRYSVSLGGIAKNNETLIYEINGTYQEPSFITKVTTGIRYAKVSENSNNYTTLIARTVDAKLSAYANNDLSSSNIISLNNYLSQQDREVLDKTTKYATYFETSYNNNYDVANANPTLSDIYVAEAFAYYNQGKQINYDQYNYRRQINGKAEDATSEGYLYLDCSSYANAAFYNAFNQNFFGIKTLENTLHTANFIVHGFSDYDYILYQVTCSDYTNATDRQNLINQIKQTLLPGDVLVYRHGATSETSGHVMVYVGNQKFLHCTGTCMKVGDSINPTTFTEKQTSAERNYGAIAYDSWDIVFSTNGSRYLFKSTSSDTVTRFAFFRPVNQANVTATTEGINRYLNQNITIEKSSTVSNLSSIKVGFNFTSTISVTNISSNSTNFINVKEILPAGVDFVSCNNNGFFDKTTNTIFWQIPTIGSAKTTSVSYTVKANGSTSHIVDSESYVNNIKTNTLHAYTVENHVMSTVTNKVADLVGTSYSDSLSFVKEAYAQINNQVFSTSDTTQSVLNNTIQFVARNPLQLNSQFYKYVVAYGGYELTSYAIADNYRLRAVKASQLSEGDVIILYNTYPSVSAYSYECYYYASPTTIYGCNDGVLKLQYSTSSTVNAFLLTLYAYKDVIILRPTVL